jgi:uncharacterized membrane protein YgcG
MKEQIGQDGFTLIDATITLLVSVLMLYTLHSGTQTSLSARKASERIYAAHLQGMDFLERVRKLPFGQASDPAPQAAQLKEFFDDDDDLGTITLTQLKVSPTSQGYQFKMASNGLKGTWEVKVTDDLDGDGNNTGPREGRSDLLKIEVRFDNKIMFQSLRSSDPSFTIIDTTADYLNGAPIPPAPPVGGGSGGSGGSGSNGGSGGSGNGGSGNGGSGSNGGNPIIPPGGGGSGNGSNGGNSGGGGGGGGPGADKAPGRGGE